MAKKKKRRRRNQKKKIMLIMLVVIIGLSVIAVGILIGKNLFSEKREDVLETYVDYIKDKKYEEMYALLDESAKESISEEEFVTRNKNIYEGIEAKNIELDISEKQAKDQPISYRVSMDTMAGEISYDNDTFFTKEDGKWHIAWSDSMIFPQLGRKDKVSVEIIPAKRGSIYDRNENLLAGQGMIQNVGLVPGKMDIQPEEELGEIAEALDISVEAIEEKLNASWVKDDSFVPLKKMTQDQLDEVYEAGNYVGKSLQDRLLGYPGILISDVESRIYPYKESTSHLLGYVQRISAEELEKMKENGYDEQSFIGKSGLEKLYEDRLRAEKGCRIFIKDEEGNEKEALAMKTAKDGENIILTIDIRWQQRLYETYKEDKSCSVVMNPKTGEVLALVSTPSFNSMDFVVGMSQKKWDELNNDERKPLFNRVRETWAPGSSFKPVIGAIGLTERAITADEDLGKSGLSWQKDESWGDYKVTTLHSYDNAVLKNALIYSDNIYFAKTALRIGADVLGEQFEKLGFGKDIPFEIGMTKSQFSNSEKIESEVQLADSGYGQGQILINPLHLACIYSAFFNAGNMIAPYLELQQDRVPSYWVENAFSQEAADTIYEDLKEVVNNPAGTAHAASNVLGGNLAGKTGTAEIKAAQDDVNGTELGWFAVYNTNASDQGTVLMLNMVEDVKGRGGSGYVVKKNVEIWKQMYE